MLIKDIPIGKTVKVKIYRRGDEQRESNAVRLDMIVRDSMSNGIILNRVKAPSGEWISLKGNFVVDVYYELSSKVEVWSNITAKDYKDLKGAGYIFATLGDSKTIQRRKYSRYDVKKKAIVEPLNAPGCELTSIVSDVSLTGFSLKFRDMQGLLGLAKSVKVEADGVTFRGRCVRVQPMRDCVIYGFKFIQDSLEVGSDVVRRLKEG